MRRVTSNQAFFLFLMALSTLLLNDFYLKVTFHNAFTGKLSDFAGLLVFPWFWSLLFPKRARLIYLITALFFVFWKLDASTPLVEVLNETLGTSFSRVLDLSDLFALSILPISFLLFQKSKEDVFQLKLGLKVGVSSMAIFAFFATSSPDEYVSPSWEFENTYTVEISKKELLTERMKFVQSHVSEDSIYLENTKFMVNHSSPLGYNLNFIIEVDSISNQSTKVSLKKLNDYNYIKYGSDRKDALTKEDFLEIFEKEFIQVLKSPKADGNPFIFWIYNG